jgi:hypothetical protein
MTDAQLALARHLERLHAQGGWDWVADRVGEMILEATINATYSQRHGNKSSLD